VIKISRGVILLIVGIVLFVPGAIMLQMVLPFPYGLILSLLVGPTFIVAGVIFLIKDQKHHIPRKSSEQTKFCKKCGKELSSELSFCTKCGASC